MRSWYLIAAMMLVLSSSVGATQSTNTPASEPAVQAAASQAPAALPRPTGPYAVGTHSVTFSDPRRRELFTKDPNDVRRVPVQIYYPAAKGCAPSHYFPSGLADVYAEELGLARGFERRLLGHACVGARAAARPARFPVVLFSHGLQHTHFSYASIIEDLASRGNIVVAIDHTYGSRGTYFTDAPLVRWDNSRWGRGEDAKKYRIAGAEYYRTWTDDSLRVLDRLLAGDRALIPATLRNRLDPARIAYLGHSFGGIAAMYAAQLDTRIKGAVNMDGGIGSSAEDDPRPRMPLPVTADVPILVLNAAQVGEEGIYAPGTHRARVRDANHMTFSDYIWLIENAGQPEARASAPNIPIKGEPSIQLTRELLALFLDCTFKSQCTTLDARLAELNVPPPPPPQPSQPQPIPR